MEDNNKVNDLYHHDWLSDSRPFVECLREFGIAINGGKIHGHREAGASALYIPKTTYLGWLYGRRPSVDERLIRMAMCNAIDRKERSNNDR